MTTYAKYKWEWYSWQVVQEFRKGQTLEQSRWLGPELGQSVVIQAERKRKGISHGKQVSKSQRWEFLRLMLSEWAMQPDWERIHSGKGNWKSRWREIMFPKICLMCSDETFGLYPIVMGFSRHCQNEIRIGKLDREKEDLDPGDQCRGPCNQINVYLLNPT